MNEIEPPPQTPLYRVLFSPRYDRQDQIRRIQAATNRTLVVYYSTVARAEGAITPLDVPPFEELLYDCRQDETELDLLLQSPGGDIDVAEKVVYLCRSRSKSFRVIVPERAKSAATLIALASDQILMSDTSELGPIDPQVTVFSPDGRPLVRPARSFLDGLEEIKRTVTKEKGINAAYYPLLTHLDPALLDYCNKAIDRSHRFAEKWLNEGMCKGEPEKASFIADELMNVEKYGSHGMVIDQREAQRIGLAVVYLKPHDRLWDAIWRLFASYEVLMRNEGIVKAFESERVSIAF